MRAMNNSAEFLIFFLRFNSSTELWAHKSLATTTYVPDSIQQKRF